MRRGPASKHLAKLSAPRTRLQSEDPKALFLGYTKIELEQTLQQSVLLDEFAKAIKKGAKIFKTPGEMGLRDVKIIEKIYQSAENGGKLVSLS